MTKQQTTLQTLIAWGDKMMKQEPMKVLSFAEAIDKAEELLEMEKEQIIDAWDLSRRDIDYPADGQQYYKETYED